jgi:hypothetical protein
LLFTVTESTSLLNMNTVKRILVFFVEATILSVKIVILINNFGIRNNSYSFLEILQ